MEGEFTQGTARAPNKARLRFVLADVRDGKMLAISPSAVAVAAAMRVVVIQGLSAPPAMIAQEAAVSKGSLFTYFEIQRTCLINLMSSKQYGVSCSGGVARKS